MEHNFTPVSSSVSQSTPSTSVSAPPSPLPEAAAPGFEDKKQKKFPIKRIIAMFIGTLIGIPLMLIGFIRLQNTLFTRAGDIAPRDVIVTETTATSATVEWYTDQETQGVIQYGTEATQRGFLAPENGRLKVHKVEIPLLTPATTYYFTIKIGEDVYDNGGEPWVVTTKQLGDDTTPSGSPPGQPAATLTPENSSSCPQTDDCTAIQELMGGACTVTDYVQCIKRQQP